MFGIRTPIKRPVGEQKSPQNLASDRNVRRSIGEWEAANSDKTPTMTQAGPAKVETGTKPEETKPSATTKTATRTPVSPKRKYPNRTAEARACLLKAKEHLKNSRNLKTEIKEGVTEAINRLYELVKQAEAEPRSTSTAITAVTPREPEQLKPASQPAQPVPNTDRLLNTLEEHSQLLLENTTTIKELKKQMESYRETMERIPPTSYAEAAATQKHNRDTLHSVVIADKDETRTGDEVLDKVRKAVDAKEGWVRVERVRKAKDRRIIMGFGTKEERDKVRKRLEASNADLLVEEVKNKDPLLVLRNVLAINKDDDILKAFKNQNRGVFRDLGEEESRIAIKYRRRARNPHVSNIVLSTSPKIWQRALEAGSIHIDLQRVKVEDQTPLVQCTRCLGYGHGKRFCKEPADACSHCGEPHIRAECPEWLAGLPPKCRNCRKTGQENAEHNAFSNDCPVKKKWDELARSAVAYC